CRSTAVGKYSPERIAQCAVIVVVSSPAVRSHDGPVVIIISVAVRIQIEIPDPVISTRIRFRIHCNYFWIVRVVIAVPVITVVEHAVAKRIIIAAEAKSEAESRLVTEA